MVNDPTGGHLNIFRTIWHLEQMGYVSGIVMTKLDGTARGGVLVPVAQASDAPIKLIGVGEGIDDLQPFDARAFARSLVGLKEEPAA